MERTFQWFFFDAFRELELDKIGQIDHCLREYSYCMMWIDFDQNPIQLE